MLAAYGNFHTLVLVPAAIAIVLGYLWLSWRRAFRAEYAEWFEEERLREYRFQERSWYTPEPPAKIFRAKFGFNLCLLATGVLLLIL